MATAPKDRVPNVFRIRLKQALCRRTWPQTDLSRKQLCHAIGVSGGTLDLWMRGQGSPSAESLADLVAFFTGRGDRTIAHEIFDIEMPEARPVVEFATQLEQMAKQMRELAPA